MPGVTAADPLVGRVARRTPGVAGLDVRDALHVLEDELDPPEAPAREDGDLLTRPEPLIELWSGRRYLYTQVPAAIAEGFASADSKGRFYNRRIRNCFPCHELRERRARRGR